MGAIESLGGTPGACTVLSSGGTATPGSAALANGAAVHAILFEDINLFSADHPGAVIVPAALAAAEASASITGRNATIGDLVLGILAGYEVHLWLGVITQGGVQARGFRTTAVFGTVGAAAAAAKVLHMHGDETVRAVVMGANTAHGVLEGFAHGTMEPYVQAGLAAQSGVISALLARSGVQTAMPAFEGPHGYLRAFADVPANGSLRNHEDWLITGVSCKPYPISGGKIAITDSALAVKEQGLDASRIEKVVARLPYGIAEFPGGDKEGPFHTMNEAQDSTQFCVAAALLGRPMSSLRTVMDEFADPEVEALTHKIELSSEHDRTGARVEVTLSGGGTLIGDGAWPERQVPSIKKMATKLRDLSHDVWSPPTADAVIEVATAEPGTPISELTRLLRR